MLLPALATTWQGPTMRVEQRDNVRIVDVSSAGARLEIRHYDFDYGDSPRFGDHLEVQSWFEPLPEEGREFIWFQRITRAGKTIIQARSHWLWQAGQARRENQGNSLEQEGFSLNHCARVKSTISSFARWLMEEKGLPLRNPTRGVDLPSQQMLAPRQLSEDQRYILRSLVEQEEDRRSAAIFALGYWAGCRVSDVSWLQMAHTHVGPKVGWLHIGYKGGKWRDIDLMNDARKPLYEYLKASGDADRT